MGDKFDIDSVQANDIVENNRDAFCMHIASSVASVLDAMKLENITAVVVYDLIENDSDTDRTEIISIVSILDILAYAFGGRPTRLDKSISHCLKTDCAPFVITGN
jgi:hypothetical protein